MQLSNLNSNQLNHLRRAIYKIGDAMSVLEELADEIIATATTVGEEFTANDLNNMRSYLNNTPHLAQLYKVL